MRTPRFAAHNLQTGRWTFDQATRYFRLRAFHDQLLSYGSLPLSVVQWLMLGDSTAAEQVSR